MISGDRISYDSIRLLSAWEKYSAISADGNAMQQKIKIFIPAMNSRKNSAISSSPRFDGAMTSDTTPKNAYVSPETVKKNLKNKS